MTSGSRGIGKAIARELAREGANVAIVARNQADLEAAARELAAETNRRMVPLAADVTRKEQVERMVADAATQLAVSRARRSGKAVVAIRKPASAAAPLDIRRRLSARAAGNLYE